MACFRERYYGIRLLNTFEIPSISDEKTWISIKIPSISIENIRFRSKKYWVFRIRKFGLWMIFAE